MGHAICTQTVLYWNIRYSSLLRSCYICLYYTVLVVSSRDSGAALYKLKASEWIHALELSTSPRQRARTIKACSPPRSRQFAHANACANPKEATNEHNRLAAPNAHKKPGNTTKRGPVRPQQKRTRRKAQPSNAAGQAAEAASRAAMRSRSAAKRSAAGTD